MSVEYPYNCEKCPTAHKLIIPAGGKMVGRHGKGTLFCESCYGEVKRQSISGLGQTVDFSTHIDKNGNEVKHRISRGKQWEIENRRISLDDHTTVINRVTGKEAQY